MNIFQSFVMGYFSCGMIRVFKEKKGKCEILWQCTEKLMDEKIIKIFIRAL
jgi:hypothetical protein